MASFMKKQCYIYISQVTYSMKIMWHFIRGVEVQAFCELTLTDCCSPEKYAI